MVKLKAGMTDSELLKEGYDMGTVELAKTML